jgi:Domain of unknown function (DUF5679)
MAIMDEGSESKGKTIAYCMKCKSKRGMEKAQTVKMKNGRPAKKGQCEVCGTKMFKIGG